MVTDIGTHVSSSQVTKWLNSVMVYSSEASSVEYLGRKICKITYELNQITITFVYLGKSVDNLLLLHENAGHPKFKKFP